MFNFLVLSNFKLLSDFSFVIFHLPHFSKFYLSGSVNFFAGLIILLLSNFTFVKFFAFLIFQYCTIFVSNFPFVKFFVCNFPSLSGFFVCPNFRLFTFPFPSVFFFAYVKFSVCLVFVCELFVHIRISLLLTNFLFV